MISLRPAVAGLRFGERVANEARKRRTLNVQQLENLVGLSWSVETSGE